MYGNKEQLKKSWCGLADSEKAHNCVKCGKCEKECPQKISIRENLATLQKELDEAVK